MTPDEYALYRQGYELAMSKAIEVVAAAHERFQLRVRTRKLDTKRRRQAERQA